MFLSDNKPKLVLMWHSLSSSFFIYHFNLNISTKGSGFFFWVGGGGGGGRGTTLKIMLFRQNNQNFIHACIVNMEFQIYLLFKHNQALFSQNGHHFLDDNFKCIFLSESMWVSTDISLKFVP